LGASFDSVEAQRAFAEKHGYTFSLLSDPDRKLGLAYRACKSPRDRFAARYTYVIGPDGTIQQAIDTTAPAAQAQAILSTL